MELWEIRKQIDAIDPRIRDLLLDRFACSGQVAEAKIASGDTTVYRREREKEILARLGEGLPEDTRDFVLSLFRKIMEGSRTLQYGLLLEALPDAGAFLTDLPVPEGSRAVRASFRVPDGAPGVAGVLDALSCLGLSMESLSLTGEEDRVLADLVLAGSLRDRPMRRFLFQLSKETEDLQVTALSPE